MRDRPAAAAQLIGVDGRRDRIVEIDTATGEVTTVTGGDDVRAERIVWAPDESFAYLIATQRDEVLVFDPAQRRIVERIRVAAPAHIVFHPTEPRAFVHGCGVAVLDTDSHRVVDSFAAWSADYLVLSHSGRWLYGVDEYGYLWLRDLWLSVSYESSLWEVDYIGGAAAAYSSDALVLAAEQAVWTFDPESRDLRRFPYRGAGMSFAMAPQSDIAVVVAHRDLVRIDLTSGATVVQPLDPPLWAAEYGWNYGSRVFFSDDASVVFMFQNRSLVAHDTASLARLWQAPLSVGDAGLVQGDGPHVLVFPRERWGRWPNATAHLVRGGRLTAQLEPARWADAAWRNADRSFYAVGNEGLERIDPDTAARNPILVDLRLGDVAIAGDTAFAVARGDGTLRSVGLAAGALSAPLAAVDPWHAEVAPLAMDPAGDRLYAVNENGLTVYDTATGAAVEHLAADDVGITHWGPVSSLAILEDGIAVLGFGYYGEEPAAAVVVDVAARQVVAEHQLARYGTKVWVAREPSGDAVLAGTGEDVYSDESVRPVVARISRAGVRQWTGEPSTGAVVALAPGGRAGVAFVATANARIGLPPALHVVDVAAGEVLAEHRLGGRVNALAGDGATVYAAVDAAPPLLLFDAFDGELLGGIPVDASLTQLEIADGDAGAHGGFFDVQHPSPAPPAGMIVAASGEEGDITVWFEDQRITHFTAVGYEAKIAFGVDGVLYAGARYSSGNFLVGIEPRSGDALAEIALDGAPGNILPTPDGALLFVETRFDSGGGLSVIDTTTHRLLNELRPRGDWRSPAMTPDGAYVVARDGERLAVLDTRSAAVTYHPFEVPAIAVAATGAGAHYLGGDGRLYRVDLDSGATGAGQPIAVATQRVVLAGGDDALVAYIEGGCAQEAMTVDAWSGQRLAALPRGEGSWHSVVSAERNHAQTAFAAQVDVWDLRDGRLVSRLVRPEGFDRGNLVRSLAAGCLDDCPQPPAAPERVRWDLLPSATPTSTPVPTATPRLRASVPVEQAGVWIEVDTAVGVPGDVVDIAIHRNSQYGENQKVTGFQLDLWLPAGVRPQEWRSGEPDCEFIGDRRHIADNYPWYRSAKMFLPEGCDPAVDCRGLRVLAAAQTELEVWPWIVCRARIDAGLEPGSYPMAVENLYLATEPRADRLQAVVGDVYVLDGRRAATPTPDRDLNYYGPTPAPTPQLLLYGRGVETTAGWVNDVEMKLGGNALAPLRGELRAVIEMDHPLRPATSTAGNVARCRSNPELSRDATFDWLPAGCAATDVCTAIAVRVDVDPGAVGFEDGHPPRWYFRPDAWLFRCDIQVDDAAEDGQYYLRFAEATFDDRSLATRDVLIDTFVPWFTPTATATSTVTATGTPTPRPRLTPRPCVAQDGTATICVDDLEASAGDTVELTVRYLSGGVAQAGVEFLLDLGGAFAPVADELFQGANVTGPCRVNPEIDKNGSAFAYRGDRIKALILALDNVDPLPKDVRLITCRLDVDAGAAPGEYVIALLEPGGAGPEGSELPLVGRPGFLRVRGTVIPSPTTTPTRLAATRHPSAMPRADARDFLEPAARGNSGCQVGAEGAHSGSVLLPALLAAVLLLARSASRGSGWQHAIVEATRNGACSGRTFSDGLHDLTDSLDVGCWHHLRSPRGQRR